MNLISLMEIVVTTNYDDTTFVIPFRDNNYNLISYLEILRYINTNLHDNRPRFPVIYVSNLMMVRRVRMTADNYHLAQVSQGIVITEAFFVPSPITHAFLCEYCGGGTNLFDMNLYDKQSEVMAFCNLSCQSRYNSMRP